MASYRRYRDEEDSQSSSSSSHESDSYVNGNHPGRTANRYSPVSPPDSRAFTPISDASNEDINVSSRQRTLRNDSSSRSSGHSLHVKKLANNCNVAQLKQILGEFPIVGGLSRLRKSDLVERAISCYDSSTSIQRKKLENMLRDPSGREKAVTSSTDTTRRSKRSKHTSLDAISSEEEDDPSEESAEDNSNNLDNNDSSYNPSDASHVSSASEEERAETPIPTTSRNNNHSPHSDANRRPTIKLTIPKSFQRASELMNQQQPQQQQSSSLRVSAFPSHSILAPGNAPKIRPITPVRPYNPNAFVVQQPPSNNYWPGVQGVHVSLKRPLEGESSSASSLSKRPSFVLNPPSSSTPLTSPYVLSTNNFPSSSDYLGSTGFPSNPYSTQPGPSSSRQQSGYNSLPATPATFSAQYDNVFFGPNEDRQLSELLRSFSTETHPGTPGLPLLDFQQQSPRTNAVSFSARGPSMPPALPVRSNFSTVHQNLPTRSSVIYRPPESRPAPPAAPPGNSSIMANNPFAKVFANVSVLVDRPESCGQDSMRTSGDSRELRFSVNLHHYAHFNARGSQIPRNDYASGRIIRPPVFHHTVFDVSGPTSIRREASLTSRGVYREIITTFYLNQANTNPNDPNYVVLIRFCQESLSKPSYEIHPDNLKLMLNGKTLVEPLVVDFGNRMKKKKNPVYNQPIEVPLSQLVTQNVVLVRWTEDCGQTVGQNQPSGSAEEAPKDYYLVIEYARRKTMEEIIGAVKQNKIPVHETVFRLYRALSGGDDDIVTDQQRVSLHCPASRSRITLPIRGRNCDHVECFDASSFLFMNKAPKARWVCPKCNKTVQFDEIVVDEFISRLLEVFVDSESIEATLENNEVVVREAKKPQKTDNSNAKNSSVSSFRSNSNGPSSSASTPKPPSNKPPPEIIVLD